MLQRGLFLSHFPRALCFPHGQVGDSKNSSRVRSFFVEVHEKAREVRYSERRPLVCGPSLGTASRTFNLLPAMSRKAATTPTGANFVRMRAAVDNSRILRRIDLFAGANEFVSCSDILRICYLTC